MDDNTDGDVNVNESAVAELPDGRVYFNTRDQNGTSPATRADAYSVDGGPDLSGRSSRSPRWPARSSRAASCRYADATRH